ncbi:hypothetical protein [Lysinibacter sp. HNR]|uniref:hypothetical protein n=1 Tax=Lysinibacter sp. HNR TaxID=3031408 RepID=UPI00243557B0|nr:hypothetical protein [Lysinibacter sp. HNR]WGD37358.1 hypothetical protein FrondiHNR_00085 [Lysinibacter sp. HNR]
MYAAIWRILPGPTWLKVIESLILVAAVGYALFYFVYPWVSSLLPDPGSTVD